MSRKNSLLLNQQLNSKKKFHKTPLAAAIIFSSALLSGAQLVCAQEGQTVADQNALKTSNNGGDANLVESVVITGAKIRELPESISLVTGEELQKFHVNNFRDIVNRIGNIRTSWQNPNTTSIFVRGVGWAAGAGVLDPSVGITIDGVSNGITGISALSNYTDIETFSVTRGPTGTQGGKNFSVGEVNIVSRAPSFTPEAYGSVTFGQLNTVSYKATLGGAVVDDLLAFRLSLHRETADGPYDNKNDTHYTWRNTDRTSARAQFLLTPSDTLKAQLIIDYVPTGREICENCFTFRDKIPAAYDSLDVNGNPVKVNYDEDAFGKIQRRWFAQKKDYTVDDYYARNINTVGEYPNTYATRGASLNVNWSLDWADLTSITGYREYNFSQGAGTHTPFEWLRAPRGTQTEYNQFSQEFKLDAQLADSVKYEGGIYLFKGSFPNTGQTERYGSDGGAWYANKSQYDSLDTNAEGRQLLLNSVDGLITQSKNDVDNTSNALYSNILWEATQKLNINAGVRVTKEVRNTNSRSFIQLEGFAPELDPVSVNNVQLGGFSSDANGLVDPTKNSALQIALADSVAAKYFNAANYAGLTTAQKKQVAYAKAVRAGRIGQLYQAIDASEYSEVLPTTDLGANYLINDTDRLFVSWKHGEKAGVSQIVNGKDFPTETEKSNSFEIGTKSLFFGNDLSLDATLYLQKIKNYIQPVFVYDEIQTKLNNNGNAAYVSAFGNVPKVQTQGVELDLAYSGFQYTTIRFSGAYTDAVYKDFKNLAKPGELADNYSVPASNGNPAIPYQAYYDATDKTLPGAPEFSGNLFVDFSYPLSGNKLFHANLNYNYVTEFNNDPSLSRFTNAGPYGVTDISIGLGRQDRKFDISLVVKNAFDQDTGFNTTWSSYKPGIPRWVGITIDAAI